MQLPSNRGFTLIELSIVLVIIALIVGGALAGQELITQSQIRKLISQKERFATAANTFRTKYNCLPGDCVSGAALGFSGGTDNNDGIIYGFGNNESQFWFWQQMYEAKLITEYAPNRLSIYIAAGDATPACDLCIRNTVTAYGPPYYNVGGWAVIDLNSPELPYLHCAASGTSLYPTIPSWRAFGLISGNFAGGPPDTMRMIHVMPLDAKIDDGKPFTGNVLAISGYMYSDSTCSGVPHIALNAPGTIFAGNFYPMTTYPESVMDVLMRADF